MVCGGGKGKRLKVRMLVIDGQSIRSQTFVLKNTQKSMAEIVHLCVVQIHTRTFRRTAICGGFHIFFPSKVPLVAHRTVRVSPAESDALSETASISLRRSRPLRYRRAAFKENIVDIKYKGIRCI